MGIKRAFHLILPAAVLTLLVSLLPAANLTAAEPTGTPAKRAQHPAITAKNARDLIPLYELHSESIVVTDLFFAADNMTLTTISTVSESPVDPSQSSVDDHSGRWYATRWNLESGSNKTLELSPESKPFPLISPNGRYIAALAKGGRGGGYIGLDDTNEPINIFDMVTGKLIFSSEDKFNAIPRGFSDDSQSLVLVAKDGDRETLQVYHLDTGQLSVLVPPAPNQNFGSISPDWRYVMIETDIDSIGLWDIQQKKLRPDIIDGVVSADFSTDGKYLAAFNEWDSAPRIIDLATAQDVFQFPESPEEDYNPGSLFFSPDNQHLVAGTGTSESTLIVNLKTRKIEATLPTGSWPYSFTPDGTALFLADDERSTTRLWDVVSNKERCTFPQQNIVFYDPTQPTLEPMSTPDLSEISESGESAIEISHSIDAPFEPSWLVSPLDSILIDHPFDMVFLNNRVRGNNSLLIWNMATCQLIADYPGKAALLGLAFSSDGSLIATSDASGAITIWGIKAS